MLGGDLALKYRGQVGDMMSLKFEALDEHFTLAMGEFYPPFKMSIEYQHSI